MSESTEIAVSQQSTALSVEGVLARISSVQELMKRAMEKGIDYGQIPGTGGKPTLLKPGAEKLNLMFKFAERFDTKKTFHDDGHLTVESTCEILARDGTFLGDSSAMCSTRESKYAYRGGSRKCPSCGKDAIKKSKFPPRNRPNDPPGFYCFAKIGGCGVNFNHDDPAIVSQSEERQKNPDIADCFNPVVRMAEKRAFVAAVRLVTGCSSIFEEEMPDVEHDAVEAAPEPAKQEPQEYRRVNPNDVQAIRERLTKLDVNEKLGVKWASKGRTDVLEDLTPTEGQTLWYAYAPKQKQEPKPAEPEEVPA